jgi:hypothetical protein
LCKSHSDYTKYCQFCDNNTDLITEHHGECPSHINKQYLIVPGKWPPDKHTPCFKQCFIRQWYKEWYGWGNSTCPIFHAPILLYP